MCIWKFKLVTVTNGEIVRLKILSLDVDPLQWPVTAAAGAQVNFTSRFGLYLEPGIAYYFDDHSGVRRYERNIRSILICSWVCAFNVTNKFL